MADPRRDDEVVMSAGGAAKYGLHIGSLLPLGFYTDKQVESPTFSGYPTDKPHLAITLKLVGIIEASQQVVQDDDAALGDQLAVISPALTRRLATCCAYYTYVALQIDDAARHLGAVSAAVEKIVPSTSLAGSGSGGGQTDAAAVAEAERVSRPEAVAFGMFGLIAALAALLICGQVIARLVRRNAEDGEVLRALGAGPLMTTSDGLIGILVALVSGVVLAMAVAVGLSPLAPIGAVRPVYPDPGVAFDWTVLGSGAALLVVVLGATAVVMAYRVSPHRAALGAPHSCDARVAPGPSRHRLGSDPGGIHGDPFGPRGRRRSRLGARALRRARRGAGRRRGGRLLHLRRQPELLGVPAQAVRVELELRTAGGLLGRRGPARRADGHAAATRPGRGPLERRVLRECNARRAGGTRPGGAPRCRGAPDAVVRARPRVGPPGVVLGPATLAALHTHIGDTVVAGTGRKSPVRLRIVGTAILPTIGSSGDPELQMGTGAVLATSLFPAAELNQQGSAIPGPNAVFVTVRRGVSQAAALRSLNRVDGVLSHPATGEAPASGVVSVLRPAEIADYRAVGATPSILAGILAVGAMGGLGLTLVASVRRRRREFALLKALGFTQRQLAATVAWQSSVSAVVGVIFGVPLGIALGRWLWTLFARGIYAVPEPSVPVLTVVLVALGAFSFANLVATFPGRIAARTPTALLLRAE
jgi:hypothetical protein